MKQRSTTALLAGIATMLVLTACAPGPAASPTAQNLGPVSKDVSSGKITLTVWDQNVDPGINQAQDQLNAAFEKKYPNITINRVSRSFTDLKTTLKLALSGDNPPDVVQANQGYPDMGAFVKAGLLRPINDYASLYGWTDYYPSGLLKWNSFSGDGKTWQGANLYGISQTGELVGLYYDRTVLHKAGIGAPPTTLAELTDDMAKVKAAGELPMGYGDVEKSPGIHLYGFALTALAGEQKVNDLVRSTSGAWTGTEETNAATVVSGWQHDGYLTPGANGVSRDDALASFGRGGSAFFIGGTWEEATLEAAPDAHNIGFAELTPSGSGTPAAMGGEGLAWAMTSKTAHANAAAAYLDFINDAGAAKTLVQQGNLPAVVPSDDTPAPGSLVADITTNYQAISKSNGIAPYLDYSTPTFYNTLTAAMQNLIGGAATPQQFTQTLQTDYAEFGKSNG